MTEREQEHLAMALEAKANRRVKDVDLKNVADWRDALLCAATNLECDQPQSSPAYARQLREVADEMVRLSLAADDLATTQGILRHAILPAVQRREDVHLIRQINSLLSHESR